MDGLFALFALVVGLGFLAAPVLAVIALVRSHRLRQRSIEAESRLAEIDAKLRMIFQRLPALGAESREPGVAPKEPAREPAPPPVITEPPPARPPVPPPSTDESPLHPRYRPPAPAAKIDGKPAAGTPTEPPPPTPPPAVKPPAPPPAPSLQIDWERWIGIRGAAVLGAVALGLAGLLFFKYSIERGLITPAMRVVLGTLAGLGCLVGVRAAAARAATATRPTAWPAPAW